MIASLSGLTPVVELPRQQIERFCRERKIRKLSVFGSAIRADFSPDSDVDILVDYVPEETPGLAFFSHQEDLSRIIGRRVDLNTAKCLADRFREQVVSEAVAIHEGT